MEQHLSISESEWRVMKIVWSNSPQTLPEILDRLKETGWSKTLYAALVVSALRYDPFLRAIPFTGCVSHITRNTGMVKWILYCLLGMGVWVRYSFRL